MLFNLTSIAIEKKYNYFLNNYLLNNYFILFFIINGYMICYDIGEKHGI